MLTVVSGIIIVSLLISVDLTCATKFPSDQLFFIISRSHWSLSFLLIIQFIALSRVYPTHTRYLFLIHLSIYCYASIYTCLIQGYLPILQSIVIDSDFAKC